MNALPLLPLAAAIGMLSQPAAADSALIITATRLAQTTDETLVPVSVLTRDDIERSSAKSVTELLGQLPGVDLSVSGGYGKPASIYLRGTSSNHVLVLIDGVRAGSATTGSFAFEQLPLIQIERIEVIRGPRSSLYGADAIGGVIQIFTRKGATGTHTTGRVALGSEGSSAAEGGLSFGDDTGQVALSFGYETTDGINAKEEGEPDEDGYTSRSGSVRFAKQFNERTQGELSWLQVESENHYDDSWAPNNDNYANLAQKQLGIRVQHDISDSLSLSGGLGRYRDESEAFDSWPTTLNTRRNTVDSKVDLYLSDDQIVTGGIDYYNEKVEGSTAYTETSRSNKGVFAQWQGRYSALNILAGGRTDDSSAYGRNNTGNINLAYSIAPGQRLLASYGTAFKAPTFNDIQYNTTLEATHSKTAEAGYEVGSASSRAAIRIFRTEYKDLVEWRKVSGTWIPLNMSPTIRGVELEYQRAFGAWDFDTALTLLDTEEDGKKPLLNRAEKSAAVRLARNHQSFGWQFEMLAKGERRDADDNAVPGYAVFNISASHQMDQNLSLSLKLQNLLDKTYQTNPGYNSLGRNWLLSLNYRR